MGTDQIIVVAGGSLLIAFIYWFFLMKKEEKGEVAKDSIDIIVKGGYTPETIVVPVGKKTILNFVRKDPSSCLEEVIIPDFKVRKYLPVDEKTPIEIFPKTKGEFRFSCAMNMFHGKIIVQ